MILKFPSADSGKARAPGDQPEKADPSRLDEALKETEVSAKRFSSTEFVTHGDRRVLMDNVSALKLAMPVSETK